MTDHEKIDISSYVAGVSLKEHFESRLQAIEKATTLARENMEKRLDEHNKLRDQLENQANTFVTKEYHTKEVDGLKIDVRELRDSKNLLEGKASMKSVIIAYIIAGIGIVISIVGVIISIIVGIIKLFE